MIRTSYRVFGMAVTITTSATTSEPVVCTSAVARATPVGPMCMPVLKSHRRNIWANGKNVAPPLPGGPAAAVWPPTVDAADIATTHCCHSLENPLTHSCYPAVRYLPAYPRD